MKKLFEKIGFVFNCTIVIAIALLSLFLGLGSVADVVVKFVTIAGGGSIGLGIVMIPFFVVGIVQIFRGVLKVMDEDIKKMNNDEHIFWYLLYIPATILGYIAVVVATYFFCTHFFN